jgi:hypothetical protein
MANALKPMNRKLVAALVTVLGLATLSPVHAQDRWYGTVFAGAMTTNAWEEVFDPNMLEFAGSSLLGIALGWDRPIGNSRFRYGFEAQIVGHAGRQDHLEFNLPLMLRYTPERPWPRRLRSMAFGIGPSHATKVPLVEVDRDGASQKDLVYWTAELEFSRPDPDASLYFRLHHRSNAYGFYKVNAGSTGLALGWRKLF